MVYILLTVLGIVAVVLTKSQWSGRKRLVFTCGLLIGGVILYLAGGAVLQGTDVIAKGDESDAHQIWLEPALYFVMLSGMLGKLTQDSMDMGKGFAFLFTKEIVLKPIIISPLVFIAIYGALGATIPTSLLLIFAFQNGYFWQTVLNRDGPGQTQRLHSALPSIPPGTSPPVFIIHGHDIDNLGQLTTLMKDKWGLTPIILKGEPGKGRTIIEKFLEEAERAVFTIALLTPDDAIMLADSRYAQARPNVTFELGWFYGRLGRERVCILFRKGTKIHSDLDGISRIEFHKSVTEDHVVQEIEREMVGAGVIKNKI